MSYQSTLNEYLQVFVGKKLEKKYSTIEYHYEQMIFYNVFLVSIQFI